MLQARLTPEALKEFINEASTAFRLKHPNIVQLLDFGIGPADTPFLTMAYAPNGTLRQHHPKGTRLPLDSIIAYVKPIVAALQHALTPPPSLRGKMLAISPEVERVVLTALAKEPKERFATVAAFARALEQAYQPKPLKRSEPPVGTTLLTYGGHSLWVNAVAWSPDGRRIASGSVDRTVQVWDAPTGAVLLTYGGHSGSVRAVMWSPDGRRIASASDDNTVQVWQAG